jgi:hypothetical protein
MTIQPTPLSNLKVLHIEMKQIEVIVIYVVEGQTTQWPKEKWQKDKQRSTKHTHKTKDRVTRTPLHFLILYSIIVQWMKALVLPVDDLLIRSYIALVHRYRAIL